MSKRVSIYVAAGFLAVLISGLMYAAARGSEGPMVTQTFASKELIPGDTWKIYINAAGTDAKMKYFFVTVEQAGGTAYPVSITRIKKEDQENLSGYLYLSTFSSSWGMDYVTLKLIVHIRDEKGRFSDPLIFPLTFMPRASVERPPDGLFQEKEVGPVMITLRPVGDDGKDSYND